MAKSHTPAVRNRIRDARAAHIELQATQRRKYYDHRRKGALRPDKYCSLIIDGMDQAKTDVPHWAGRVPGWADALPGYRQRIIGVKVHWKGRCFTFLYLVDGMLGGGANLTIECLKRTLQHLPQMAGSPLPPILYCQFDNCGENKCKTVFAYMDHLVHAGMFSKIKVGFLMTGHTHEDIGKYYRALCADCNLNVQ